MNAVSLVLVLSLCFVANINLVAVAEKTPTAECTSALEGELKQNDGARLNNTCGSIAVRVEICNNYTWKTICDNNWTQQDASVACRQLGYSGLGATVEKINLAISKVVGFVPECLGSEENITSCPSLILDPVPVNCDNDLYELTCFLNDSSVSLCYSTPMVTTSPTTTTDSAINSTTMATFPETSETTPDGSSSTEFLTSPTGIGIISIICVVVLFIIILLVVIVLLVCRKSSVAKLEQSRVSPRDLENSLEDSHRYQPSKFNVSPGQDRDISDDAKIEQYILASDPLYERVQDIKIPILAQAPESMSSNETGHSSEYSPLQPTYSTLERNQTLEDNATYSTLNMEKDQVYAQVEPFINGGLPGDASLQFDPELDNFDVYHKLDRSSSQSSYRKNSVSSSPPMRPSKPYSSPKTPRNPLPSISDVESPVYAELNSPTRHNGDGVSTVSNSAVVSSSGHRQLKGHHSNTITGRPVTHEQVSPKDKSSTLPHPSRSGPSLNPNINSDGVDLSAMYAQVDKSAKGNNTWV